MMETNRIILRPWRESDAEALFKYASDPDVGPRAGWPPHKSVEESLEVIRTIFHNDTTWAIELKESGEAIGAMGYLPCEGNNLADQQSLHRQSCQRPRHGKMRLRSNRRNLCR